MELSIQKKVTVQAKTISIYCKVRDNFTASIKDQDGDEIYDQGDGYVWGLMPGDHYGDYLILDIDIDTGQITNWKTPTKEQVQQLIDGEE